VEVGRVVIWVLVVEQGGLEGGLGEVGYVAMEVEREGGIVH